ncbi:MAG: type II toxin-antitoxin system PemK/MazF family toxin [Acidobacteriota bacterium]|nr:type II toxin-antitoxin system PemK/MazF family toxin [Acidobacteriota bacterium]
MPTHRVLPKGQKVAFPHRGDIYLVSFDPTVGSEIQKTRPALVIQNDIGNQYSPITIVAAITSKFDLPPYPTEVVMEAKDSGLSQTSAVVLNQIRSVDRQGLIKRIGKASPEIMGRVDRAIQISLGLVEI